MWFYKVIPLQDYEQLVTCILWAEPNLELNMKTLQPSQCLEGITDFTSTNIIPRMEPKLAIPSLDY